MAGNQTTIVFAGDSKGVQQAAKKADDAIESVGDSATTASDDFERAGQSSEGLTGRLGSLGAGVSGMTDAVDSASAALQGMVDIQNYSRERAQRLARAQADVEQAYLDQRQAAIDLEQSTVDLNQAQADGNQAALDTKQAAIDLKQAQLDAKVAYDDYNKAVKEHGVNSDEAKQAQIDLTQANLDENQALEDSNQARIDANQALVDAKQYALDGAQAVRDGKDAQLNLNDAMAEANPSGLQQWNEKLQLITPILSGLVGIIGLVTAVQWAWNAAMTANPIGLVIAAVAVLIGVIVLIATKTDWFQRAWRAIWGGITSAAKAVGRWFSGPFANFFVSAWDKIVGVWGKVTGWFSRLGSGIKRVFSGIGNAIKNAFVSAFNWISRAWNNTVGRLSFTIPGWVPGLGGNSFSAPKLPTFHSGGKVPGVPGQEVLALLQAGEEVKTTSSQVGNSDWIPLPRGDVLLDTLLALIAERIGQKGGRAAQLGIRVMS